MQEKISRIEEELLSELKSAKDSKDFEEIRIKFLGRKGEIALLFEEFKTLPKEEKPKYGQRLNQLKNQSQQKFDEYSEQSESSGDVIKKSIDLSLPGKKPKLGSRHILTQTLNEINDLFKYLGFSIYEGPELESDYHNFEALNFPEDHPARDMQDTFFVNDDFLLRTHTSPVQIRLMQSKKPPIRALMPGKVYRNEALSFKSYSQFYQVEGLYVDENVTFAELKGTLVYFIKEFYGKDVKFRFRPSFFPFTEPSAEVDIWWDQGNGKGKWMEILGCGMVDPNVLEKSGIDSEKFTGYAFGMGVDRIALRKYNISDIRIFYDNDFRFLKQF